jgi:hypothetical protein
MTKKRRMRLSKVRIDILRRGFAFLKAWDTAQLFCFLGSQKLAPRRSTKRKGHRNVWPSALQSGLECNAWLKSMVRPKNFHSNDFSMKTNQ